MSKSSLPKFSQLIGNSSARKSIVESVIVAKTNEQPIPNILAIGSSGCGKTTLAKATAELMDAEFYEFLAQMLDKSVDKFLEELKIISDHQVLIFLDEIHQLSITSQECLYPILDSKFVTIFAATTDTGKLLRPFQNRFPIVVEIESYTHDESIQIVEAYCQRSGYRISTRSKYHISIRSRGVPRTIEHHLNMIWTKVQFKLAMGQINKPLITEQITLEYFNEKGIDSKGLTKQEQAILKALLNSGVLSLTALASICQIDEDQIKKIYEPYLMSKNFITKTPRGRMLTPTGINHIVSK